MRPAPPPPSPSSSAACARSPTTRRSRPRSRSSVRPTSPSTPCASTTCHLQPGRRRRAVGAGDAPQGRHHRRRRRNLRHAGEQPLNPGVLKNAIDRASRLYGQSAWTGKPAGVLGISIGPIGTACAQQHLRTMLGYLDMPTLGQPEVFLTPGRGSSTRPGPSPTREPGFLQGWMDKYVVREARPGSA